MEYLPASKEDQEGKFSADREVVDMSELYTDIVRRSSKDSIPRASSLSSIDSIMTPNRMSGEDLDTTCSSIHASTEPSDCAWPRSKIETPIIWKEQCNSRARGYSSSATSVNNSKRNDSWLHDQKESIFKVGISHEQKSNRVM